MKAKNELIRHYLDYFNNFLTVRRFAEYYDITEPEASIIIEAGRDLHEITVNLLKQD